MIPPRPSLDQLLGVLAPTEDPDALIEQAIVATDLPWYARVLAGASAWVATSILLCGVGAMGLWFEPLALPVGVMLLVGGTGLRRLMEPTSGAERDFGIQAALIGTLLGRGLVAMELLDSLGDVGAAMAMALLELGLVVVYADRAQRFASTLMAGAWIHLALAELNLPAVWWILLPTALVFAALRTEAAAQGSPALRDAVAPVAYGALAYSWFGLAWCLADGSGAGPIGPLLLLLAAWGVYGAFSQPGRALGPIVLRPVGWAALALGVPIALALSWGAPGLPIAVGLALVGFHRRDLLLSGVATAGIIGWTAFFYYDLELALSTKGVLLLGSGAALWLAAGLLSSSQDREATAEPMPRRGLLAAGLVLPLVVGSVTVLDLERIRVFGEPVYLELRPQDPRSMVQGDFMRLATRVEREAQLAGEEVQLRGNLVLRRDPEGVGHFSRVDDGSALAEGELQIDYRIRHDRVTVGVRSFLFEEGTAAEHQRARYGEYRVLPGGRALLVGLRDAELEPVGTALAAF